MKAIHRAAALSPFTPVEYDPLEWRLLVSLWFADDKYIARNSELSHVPKEHVRVRGRDSMDEEWDYGTAYFEKEVCIVKYESDDSECLNMFNINPCLFQFDWKSFFDVPHLTLPKMSPKSLLRAEALWPIFVKNPNAYHYSVVTHMLTIQPLLVLPIGQFVTVGGMDSENMVEVSGKYKGVNWIARIDRKDLDLVQPANYDDDMDPDVPLQLKLRSAGKLFFEDSSRRHSATVTLEAMTLQEKFSPT